MTPLVVLVIGCCGLLDTRLGWAAMIVVGIIGVL